MNGVRVSIYIVTYRNSVDLNRNISSILASGADVRINVINNHSQFFLEPRFEKEVTVLHNSLRPDFSTGHLSRNWNQALLHGFKDLKNPANDIVVTVQDDVIFKADWLTRLVVLHGRYSFITQGLGDAFCSYSAEAVIRTGLWDERFCSIGFKEADYFLRSLIYNRAGCSINDLGHGRLHNPVEGNAFNDPLGSGSATEISDSLMIQTPQRNFDRKDAHASSMKFHALGEAIFRHKWGLADCPWTAEHHAIRKPLVPSYMMYPYFEKDVEGLRDKNYIVAEEEAEKRWLDFSAQLRGGVHSAVKDTGAAAPRL
jgi:hypothetical protein